MNDPHQPGPAAQPAPTDGYVEVARGRSKRALRDAALVLQAAGIDHSLQSFGNATRVFVQRGDEARAREELSDYSSENVNWPPAAMAPPPQLTNGALGGMLYGVLIAAVYFVEHAGWAGLNWRELGVMHAGSVRGGELWRTITALTLHVDLTHLVSNLVFGGLFGAVAAWTLGNGVTWFGTLLAGAGGNYVETFLVDPSHRAVGASTAIFGTLGLMVAAEWTRRGDRKLPWVRRAAPLFAGAVLFGWFGGGGSDAESGSRVDVLAHATGFVVGGLIGILVGRLRLTTRLGQRGQHALVWASLAMIVAAWAVAIERS